MPSKEHRVSRRIFINEAKKIKNKAFKNWLRLLPEIKHTIDDISKLKLSKPTLFISGIEDYLFVRQIEEYVKDKSNCFLEKVNNSGHIVNIDQYQTFNKFALRFLKIIMKNFLILIGSVLLLAVVQTPFLHQFKFY